jgi:hypothetical protein
LLQLDVGEVKGEGFETVTAATELEVVRYSSEKVRRIRPPPRSGTETMTIVGQLLPIYARPAALATVASTGLEMLNEVTPGLGFVEPVVRPTGMLPHEKRQALYQCSAQ